MNKKLFLNNEVSKIVGLTPRQVVHYTEKGLIIPEIPALKSGLKREYSYKNLIEFGIVKFLLDSVGVQFHNCWVFMKLLKDDGIIDHYLNKMESNGVGSLFYIYDSLDTNRPGPFYDSPFFITSKKNAYDAIKSFNKEELNMILNSAGFIAINLKDIKNLIDMNIKFPIDKRI